MHSICRTTNKSMATCGCARCNPTKVMKYVVQTTKSVTGAKPKGN